MKTICDTNIILRYILHDDEKLYNKAKKEIEKSPIVTMLVMSEVVYVLNGTYKIPRDEIVETLIALSNEVIFEEKDLLLKTLENYRNYKLDLVDCYLLARKQILKEEVVTFDMKLIKTLKD